MPMIVTEADRAANASRRGIPPHDTVQDLQDIDLRNLLARPDAARDALASDHHRP
jgi:hypothetical protein